MLPLVERGQSHSPFCSNKCTSFSPVSFCFLVFIRLFILKFLFIKQKTSKDSSYSQIFYVRGNCSPIYYYRLVHSGTDLSLNLHSEKNIYHAIIYFYIILIISEINMIDIFLKGISHTYTTKNRVSLINKIVE